MSISFERYREAVLDNARRPDEGFSEYIVRIAELAAELEANAKGRLPYRDDSEDTNWTPQ